MNKQQREAALRLAEGPRTSGVLWARAVVELLRELASEPANPAPGYCKHCKQYTIEEPLQAEPVQEPILWYRDFGAGPMLCAPDHLEARPLYANPPQQRKPLTDEQVWCSDEIMECNSYIGARMNELMRLIRAVEAAHGITGGKE